MSNTPNPKNIKALALDLDGTVLSPGTILSERSIRAINNCMRRNIKVIIATGRAIYSAEPFRAALGVEGPMIYFNGAVIADMPSGKILKTTLLDIKAAEFCVDLAREMGLYYQLYLPSGNDDNRIILMAERDGPERKMYHEHSGIMVELGDLKEALRRPGLEGCVKTMFLAEPERQAAFRPRLEEHFGESVYIARTLTTFLEIMNNKVSKGRGLSFVMERLALKSEEVIAIGDEENDLPMFDVAGFSAATANAKDIVKAQADLVIGSNAEDGVAVFLEELFGV